MTMEALEAELTSLEKSERKHIMAFLVGLQIRDDTDYQETLAKRCDNDSPDYWLTGDDLDNRLKSLEQ